MGGAVRLLMLVIGEQTVLNSRKMGWVRARLLPHPKYLSRMIRIGSRQYAVWTISNAADSTKISPAGCLFATLVCVSERCCSTWRTITRTQALLTPLAWYSWPGNGSLMNGRPTRWKYLRQLYPTEMTYWTKKYVSISMRTAHWMTFHLSKPKFCSKLLKAFEY